MASNSPLPLVPLTSPSLPLASQLGGISLAGTPSPAPEHDDHSPSVFESLPAELIEAVAKAVARLDRVGPPAQLGTLILLSRRFHDVLGSRNAGFYADLFKERFDAGSLERRWAQVRSSSSLSPLPRALSPLRGEPALRTTRPDSLSSLSRR